MPSLWAGRSASRRPRGRASTSTTSCARWISSPTRCRRPWRTSPPSRDGALGGALSERRAAAFTAPPQRRRAGALRRGRPRREPGLRRRAHPVPNPGRRCPGTGRLRGDGLRDKPGIRKPHDGGRQGRHGERRPRAGAGLQGHDQGRRAGRAAG